MNLTRTRSCKRSAQLLAHEALIRKIAGRLRARLPAGIDMDELMQAGLIGLNDALSRFVGDQGASFDSYASRRIQGAMLDSLRSNDSLPREARARQRELRAAVQELEHRLLRAPRAQEVANELGWSLAAVHACMAEAGGSALRDGEALLDDEGDAEILHTADDHADPLDSLQRRQRHRALNTAFGALEERERQVMQMLYEGGLDHRGAAVTLGVSPSRVSQMHAAAVEKLKRRLRDW